MLSVTAVVALRPTVPRACGAARRSPSRKIHLISTHAYVHLLPTLHPRWDC